MVMLSVVRNVCNISWFCLQTINHSKLNNMKKYPKIELFIFFPSMDREVWHLVDSTLMQNC